MNPTDESLENLLAHAERYAEMSLRYCGSVPGTLLLQCPSGPAMYVPQGLGDNESKDQFATTARQIAIAQNATASVLVLEAWVAQATPGIPFDLDVPPSQAPNRQEVVALLGESRGARKVLFLPIRRHATGAFAGLGPGQEQPCDYTLGRFTQILPAQPPTPQEQARARAVLESLGLRKGSSPASKVPAPRYWH